MAILDVDNTYCKVIPEDCFVKGKKLYVTYCVYKDASDRNKEKKRENDVGMFFVKLNKYIDSTYLTLREKYKNKSETELICDTEFLESSNYYEKICVQSELVKANLKLLRKQNSSFKYCINKQTLLDFGFNEQWVSDPVVINGIITVYAGDTADDEVVNCEFCYNILKKLMNKEVKDI